MTRTIPCPHCARMFGDAAALASHSKRKHRVKPERPPRIDGDSLWEIAVDAQTKHAAGEPLDALERSMRG